MLDIFYMIICRLLLTFNFFFLLSLPNCLHHSGLKVQIVFVHFDNGRFVSCFDNCDHSIRQLVWKTDRRTRRRRQREGRRDGGRRQKKTRESLFSLTSVSPDIPAGHSKQENVRVYEGETEREFPADFTTVIPR